MLLINHRRLSRCPCQTTAPFPRVLCAGRMLCFPHHECESHHANIERIRHDRQHCVAREVGLEKLWEWGMPPTFGAVGSGECEIFLCHGAQGGRGRGSNTTTFQKEGDEAGDKGVWMSVWVDDVDAVHKQCVAAGLEVTFPPNNMPWHVREMHLRHPDGHVFRVSRGIKHE